ncbi:MAG TPA: manganese efflux pump MntP family protein [Candidatus Binatia bacterium]|nr:manganese efflux pump MntP family protein [Candidatus Binatia bacterium]
MTELVLIAIGVSMDAAAVAAAFAVRGATSATLLRLSATFGSFQLAMSLAGALGGAVVSRYLGFVDHWIAFALLVLVGGRMIREALENRAGGTEPAEGARADATWANLSMLGLATSIDALAVGVTLPALGLGAAFASVTIGIFTFALSFAGAWLGRRAGARAGTTVELAGGAILIGLGVTTLIDHALASGM